MSEHPHILIVTPMYPPAIGGPATYAHLLDRKLPHTSVLDFGQVMRYPYIIRHIVFFFRCMWWSRGADIVFALDPLGVGLPAGIAAKLHRKKFILKIVGDRAWETKASFSSKVESLDTYSKKRFVFSPLWFLKLGQRFSAWLADRIIVPSEYLKKIVSNWGTNADKIKVIYNSFTQIEVGESKEGLRAKMQIEGKLVVSAGRLEKWKGFDTVIECISELPDTELIIAGDGPERENLEAKVKELKLEDRVALLGRIPKEDLYKYIKSADLFVLNTFYEGLSHVLLETMSLGTPILTTKVGGNPELIEDRVSGRLIEYKDTEGLRKAIVETLEDESGAKKFAYEAEKKVENFTQERMLTELRKVLW